MHVGRVFDVYEVQLEVLPRRDVKDPVGILLGHVGRTSS